jgi:hypothetical protein
MKCADAINFWFSLNEKTMPGDCQLTGNELAGYTLTAGMTSVTISRCIIGTAEFLIIVDSIMSNGGHPFAFTFYKKGNQLLSRYFWCSRSEGCWRAGTGFRPAKDKDGNKLYDFFGGFIKGQEHVFGGGYTFETQIHPVLEKKLSDLYKARERAKDVKTINFNKDIGSKAIKEFLIRPEDTDNIPAKNILSKYMNEVQIVPALDDKIHDKKLSKSLEEAIGATTLQKTAQQGKNYLSDFKKANSPLWQLLVTCLEQSPINKVPYVYYSDLLKQNVKVESYLLPRQAGLVLKNVVVEIAYTENAVDMEFKNKARTMTYKINSPICWVKSVYIQGELSNFGNYKEYPWDLSFLPQKPMDYDKQISPYLKQRESNKPDAAYTSLALFNEKYSPLIQEFKRRKGFPPIKTTVAYAEIDGYLRGLNNPEFVMDLSLNIMESCKDYLDFNRANPSVAHGSTGRKRVLAFFDKIYNCKTYAEINKITYDLFVENTVDGKCYTSSYLLFSTGKIATRASSYIVYFCDALYKTMVSDLTGFFDEDAKISKIGKFKLDIKDKKVKGMEHALTRAAIYMKTNNVPSHCTDSATLEGIIKAMAANT